MPSEAMNQAEELWPSDQAAASPAPCQPGASSQGCQGTSRQQTILCELKTLGVHHTGRSPVLTSSGQSCASAHPAPQPAACAFASCSSTTTPALRSTSPGMHTSAREQGAESPCYSARMAPPPTSGRCSSLTTASTPAAWLLLAYSAPAIPTLPAWRTAGSSKGAKSDTAQPAALPLTHCTNFAPSPELDKRLGLAATAKSVEGKGASKGHRRRQEQRGLAGGSPLDVQPCKQLIVIRRGRQVGCSRLHSLRGRGQVRRWVAIWAAAQAGAGCCSRCGRHRSQVDAGSGRACWLGRHLSSPNCC